MLSFSRHGSRSGPLVVFLHGAGISSWMWEPLVARIPEIDALLVDLPGHGKSNKINWVSLDQTANNVGKIVSKARSERDVHIVGISLGAYVGLTLLAQRPYEFSTAILSGFHMGHMPRKWLMKSAARLLAPFATQPFFARKTAQMFDVADQDIARFVLEAGKTDVGSFKRASVDGIDFVLPEAVDGIETQVLVTAGSREDGLILNSLGKLAASIPNCTSYLIQDGGHAWPFGKPDLFVEIVRNQIAGLSPDSIVEHREG